MSEQDLKQIDVTEKMLIPQLTTPQSFEEICERLRAISREPKARDEAGTRVGYLFTMPFQSRNETFEELLACLVRYEELTEADVTYIKENLNYNSTL